MKADKYQKRFYRDRINAKDLHMAHIAIKETDLQILTDRPIDRDFVMQRISLYRRNIEDYISRDRRFLTALKPLSVERNASSIVRRMSEAALRAQVGPMAAVAGAVAEFLGRDLLRKGHRDVIVENGGDIFLKSRKPRTIGIYAGKSKLWNKLSLKIGPKDTPLGICASSGKVGHSLSFGCADCVAILSRSPSLADAVATATANRVKSEQDLYTALEFARSIKGVLGAVIILGNNLISWGAIEFAQ